MAKSATTLNDLPSDYVALVTGIAARHGVTSRESQETLALWVAANSGAGLSYDISMACAVLARERELPIGAIPALSRDLKAAITQYVQANGVPHVPR